MRRAWIALATGLFALSACTNSSSPSVVPSSPPLTTAPPTPTWQSMAKAPIAGRIAAGTVWTGREMIVWGGVTRVGVGVVLGVNISDDADGAAYDPATDSWRTIAPAPPGVLGEVGSGAAWTGSVAVFWANRPPYPAAGAVYDPEADSWQRLPKGPLGARLSYVSVWTGREMLIVGGNSGQGPASPPAAAIDPTARSWRLIRAFDPLIGYSPNGAVWDGQRAFLMGPLSLCPEKGVACKDSRPLLVSYSPSTDTVREIDLSGAPFGPRQLSLLKPIAWTGSEVAFSRATVSAGLAFYDPAKNQWRVGRAAPCGVVDTGYTQTAWIGDRYVIPCGADRLQIYDPATNTWEDLAAGPSPLNSRCCSAIVWTGTALIAWSGMVKRPGNPTLNSGSRIDLRA